MPSLNPHMFEHWLVFYDKDVLFYLISALSSESSSGPQFAYVPHPVFQRSPPAHCSTDDEDAGARSPPFEVSEGEEDHDSHLASTSTSITGKGEIKVYSIPLSHFSISHILKESMVNPKHTGLCFSNPQWSMTGAVIVQLLRLWSADWFWRLWDQALALPDCHCWVFY